MNRYYIIVEGQVQGVGFRSFVHMQALDLNLTGRVKNLDNGMVEIELQGEEKNINECIKRIKNGNMFINVTNYSLKKIPLKEDEFRFRVDYY